MKKRSISIVLLLSMLLSLFPSYAYPAVFGSDENICGIEEHTHNDDCYSIVSETKELICDGKHIHDESCYMDKWVCEVEDSEHTHSDECYQKELVCELDKLEHTHLSDCYDVETGELVCEKDELEHTHSDACYTVLPVIEFTCELEEHTHIEDCFLQVEEEEIEQDENQNVIENEENKENEENQEIEDNNDQTIIDDENNNQEIIDDDNQTTIEDENNQGIIDDENDSNIVEDNNQGLLEEEIGKDSPHDKQDTVKSTVAVKKFVNAAEKLLDDAEYNRVSEDELFEETLEVRFLGNSLTEEEASTKEVVTTVMALSSSPVQILSSTDWTSMGLSSGYKGFRLWAPLATRYGGWLGYADVYGNSRYIYSGNQESDYDGIAVYISDYDNSLYVKPGSNYKLELTEAGVLNYGSGWDITVSSGKNYSYKNMVGNASVSKENYNYGSASYITWTRLKVNRSSLGDVIKVGAYVDSYFLKFGWPTVRIFNDDKDVSGKTISVNSGVTIPISAIGYLDNTEWDGTITLSVSDSSKATIQDGQLIIKEDVGGSIRVTATWKDSTGYFKATAYTWYSINDLSKVVESIEVKDYKDTYYRLDSFVDQGVIIAHLGNGKTEEVPFVKARVKSGFETRTVGIKTLTVEYKGCTTTCDINVLWIPAKIEVEVLNPEEYGSYKRGKIIVTGDVDYILLPGSPDENGNPKNTTQVLEKDLTEYIFEENGEYTFTVIGKDTNSDKDIAVITTVDKVAPQVSYSLEENKVILKVYDDYSGLKNVKYFMEEYNNDTEKQNVGEENVKILEINVEGITSGTYRVLAVDFAGNSKSVDITINLDSNQIEEEKPEFVIYVPGFITVDIDKDGTVTIPSDLKIYNGVETEAIVVEDVSVTTYGDWELKDSTTSAENLEGKDVTVTINNVTINSDGTSNMSNDWVIEKDSYIDLDLKIFAAPQEEDLERVNLMKINFVANWKDKPTLKGEGGAEGHQYILSIVDVKNGTIQDNLTSVFTDITGKIISLPEVTPKNSYYNFIKWVNADNEEQEITVGMTVTQDMNIKPILQIKDGYTEVNLEIVGGHAELSLDSMYLKNLKEGATLADITPMIRDLIDLELHYTIKGYYDSDLKKGNLLVPLEHVIVNGETVYIYTDIDYLERTEGEYTWLESKGFWFKCTNMNYSWDLQEAYELTYKDDAKRKSYNIFDFFNTYCKCSSEEVFRLLNNGYCILRREGEVKSDKSAAIITKEGSILFVEGSNMLISGATYGVYIGTNSIAKLAGGTYVATQKGGKAIYTEDGDYDALLAPGYAYFDMLGNILQSYKVEEYLNTYRTIYVKSIL